MARVSNVPFHFWLTDAADVRHVRQPDGRDVPRQRPVLSVHPGALHVGVVSPAARRVPIYGVRAQQLRLLSSAQTHTGARATGAESRGRWG